MASIKRIGKDKFGVPIWEAVYRRTPGGKQIRRRFHKKSRADVERAVLLDSGKSDIGLKWSEGVRLYLEAKRLEGKTAGSLENTERAAKVLTDILGDIAIEDTTPETFKSFMSRCSTPKVANHHRRELFAVANYLKRHTNKVSSVPFADVPPLPVKAATREPIPADRLGDYLDALPPHIRRPIMMVLLYGLRSTSICDLTLDSLDGNFLKAVDKGLVKRRIPMDDMLKEIIGGAVAWRNQVDAKRKALFVNSQGSAWDRTSLLRAAQRAWAKAGLERKKIHEVRHTLGTLAGKSFSPGMVQAAMGHRSRKSAEVYFHPTEEMAAEVRQKIITTLSHNLGRHGEMSDGMVMISHTENGEYSCPHCHRKFLIIKKKGRKL